MTTLTMPSVSRVEIAARRIHSILTIDRNVERFIVQTMRSAGCDQEKITAQLAAIDSMVKDIPKKLLNELILTAQSVKHEPDTPKAAAQHLFTKTIWETHPDDCAGAATVLEQGMRAGVFSPSLSSWPQAIALALAPRAAAHVICTSLGYATGAHAGRLVANALDHEPDFCEWIDSMARPKPGQTYRQAMADATRSVVKNGLSNPPYCSPRRKRHSGYMSDYTQARVVVIRELIGTTPPGTLAAWF